MADLDRGLIEFLFNQGVGIAFGAIALVALIVERRQHNREKLEVQEKLRDLLRERKSDRDAVMKMLGRLEARLESAEQHERIAHMAMAEYETGPKRRALDRAVAEILKARDRSDDDPRDRDMVPMP